MHLPRPVVVGISAPTFRLVLSSKRSPTVQRRLTDACAVLFRAPRGTNVDHVVLGGRPAERVTVGASERSRAVLYLHGGGYVTGSPRVYRAMAAHLARASATAVFNLDYRLAPEHRYPAALEDTVAAFTELVQRHGYLPGEVAIAGDSAGGGLAVAATRRLIDAGLRPAALALLSPWTDPADNTTAERDFVINRAWAQQCADYYGGHVDRRDPGYAPMWAKLGDLPPTLVHYGAHEMLNPQIRRFVGRVESAGAEITATELPTLWHSGHLEAGLLREASDATHDAGLFLAKHLH